MNIREEAEEILKKDFHERAVKQMGRLLIRLKESESRYLADKKEVDEFNEDLFIKNWRIEEGRF